jgi:hypothetical protein
LTDGRFIVVQEIRTSPAWPAARIAFTSALLLFVVTIGIGILNGLDLYNPDHDTLITHVHAGTLGWITLATSGAALLMFASPSAAPQEVKRAKTMAWAITIAIALYVLAFFAGDRIPGDRFQRPIFGTLLFVVVIWFAVWLFRANSRETSSSVARLGLLLAWISLLIGSVLGVALGVYTARGEIPGLDDETAAAVAEGHPPAMVIGFLILAAMAVLEWLFRRHSRWADDKLGAAQMWILFTAGTLANIGFLSRMEEELLGPANLLMIVGVVILVVRYRKELLPSGWKGSGTSAFAKVSSLFLVVYVILGTVLIAQVVSGSIDFDALTESQTGLLLAFDHTMFIGVMTNLLFGAIVLGGFGRAAIGTVDKVVLWGVNLGIAGFIVGLLTVSPVMKRISTPIMGISLLIGIFAYLGEMRASNPVEANTTV